MTDEYNPLTVDEAIQVIRSHCRQIVLRAYKDKSLTNWQRDAELARAHGLALSLQYLEDTYPAPFMAELERSVKQELELTTPTGDDAERAQFLLFAKKDAAKS